MSPKPRRRLRRKRKKPNYVLRSLLFLLLILIAVYFFLQSAIFNVKYITVFGNKELSSQDIVRLSGLKAGPNIFSLDFRPALAALSTNPLIGESKVEKRYPSGLEIHIFERKAIALIPSQNGMMYLDEYGYCIREKREVTSLDLPVITGIVVPAAFPLGKQLTSPDLAMGLDVVKQLDENLRQRIAEINVKNNYITLFLSDKSEVRIGLPDRLKEKISLFDSIINEEKKKKSPKTIQYIDVSIEGAPVVKYKENW